MTEAARKTLEEVNKQIRDRLNEKIESKTLGEAIDDVAEAVAVLSGVINRTVSTTKDPIVAIGGATLSSQLPDLLKALNTYHDLCEASDLIEEMRKEGKNNV